eukprot:TRINITY_DN7192_c0_g1_i1.p1 TRINITY_DN7192_c0_g1~~TRINITY_DN7192_c0_g1_i1.p1  ORF type:complete len:184 (-),score=12.31 TRINITY_DN7192_c0_g1_i1:328-879(-)
MASAELPRCHNGLQCIQLQTAHQDRYSPPCRDPTCQLTDFQHCRLFTHNRATMCRFGSSCTLIDNSQHCLQFSHAAPVTTTALGPIPACMFGAHCTQIADPSHRDMFSHPCRYGNTCRKLDPVHLRRFHASASTASITAQVPIAASAQVPAAPAQGTANCGLVPTAVYPGTPSYRDAYRDVLL